jgi:hypothetical protein
MVATSRRALDRFAVDVEDLHAAILRSPDQLHEQRRLLDERQPNDQVLIGVLRRAVPPSFLDAVVASEPWNRRSLVLAAVALSPRISHVLAMKVLPQLPWRALAQISSTQRLSGPVRLRAETLLKEILPDLKLGERIALARQAANAILRLLLVDTEGRVVEAALMNPRLKEEDVLYVLARDGARRTLLEQVAASWRWRESYAVRLALVAHPLTPLSLSLGRLTGLLDRDLRRVAASPALVPLVQAAALRVLDDRARAARSGRLVGGGERGEDEDVGLKIEGDS